MIDRLTDILYQMRAYRELIRRYEMRAYRELIRRYEDNPDQEMEVTLCKDQKAKYIDDRRTRRAVMDVLRNRVRELEDEYWSLTEGGGDGNG